jgi:hypothetical protein
VEHSCDEVPGRGGKAVRAHYDEGSWRGSVGVQWIKMLQCQCAMS